MLILMSCTCSQQHFYYSPPAQNVPMVTTKGEVALDGGGCSGLAVFDHSVSEEKKATDGFYGHAAYGIGSHIGLSGTVMHLKESKICYTAINGVATRDISGSGSGYAFDLGAGYFNTFDSFFPKAKHPELIRHALVELYGGLGQSGQRHTYHDSIYTGTSDLQACLLYLQPALGIKTKWFQVAGSLRFNNYFFTTVATEVPGNYPDSEYVTTELRHINFIRANRWQPFIEPAITVRIGYKFVMLHIQYCVTHSLRHMEESSYEYDKISIGLHIMIPSFAKRASND